VGRSVAEAYIMSLAPSSNVPAELAADRDRLVTSKAFMSHTGGWGMKELSFCEGGRLHAVVSYCQSVSL